MEKDSGIRILPKELNFRYVHSSGPGGQNINKVATAAQLRFDVQNSPSLKVEVKERLVRLAGMQMTEDGILIITAKRYRSRIQNRADAMQRLATLLEKASAKPKKRHATQPTITARMNRLSAKKKRSAVKKLRQISNEE
jgi:ribosome-associated protein